LANKCFNDALFVSWSYTVTFGSETELDIVDLLVPYQCSHRPSVRHCVSQSVSLSAHQSVILSGSFDNLKTIKARRMTLGTWKCNNVYNIHAQHLGRNIEGHSLKENKFIIWSLILKLFHVNDHHVETTCREQNMGRYLEGQCYSITLN